MANFVECSIRMQNIIMVALEICLVLEFVLILLRVTQSAGLKRIVVAITLFVFSFLVMTILLNDHQYSMGKLDHSPIFPKLPAVLVFCGVIGVGLYLIWRILK